jgi:hypothetical protein
VLARQNKATAARWQQHQPDEATISARVAELLAQCRANPAIRVTDEAKAADYFRARAIARPHASRNEKRCARARRARHSAP